MHDRTGFTLIELLVVITIIVVLLALLTPALDKAIYQAELAVCAANQKAVVNAVVAYAAGSRRYYPQRAGQRAGINWHPAWIYNGNDALNALGAAATTQTGELSKQDDRIVLRSFLALNKHLNDPLTGPLDFEDIDADAHAYSTTALWFGFGYDNFGGMYKIGDRIRWTGNIGWSGRRGAGSYNLLVSDRDMPHQGGRIQSTHPDRDGRMVNRVCQNERFDLEATGTGADSLKLTISTWTGLTPRGESDLNYGFQDGSVRRYDQLKYNDTDMDTVPSSSNGTRDWALLVPPPDR
jgi:prepilin-type N-terminal cleavage/methylation domain-containing protein